MKAIVIGSGVAGPVAAMALRRAGIDATVYEAHQATSAEVGSYLTVATNGLDALRAIDAHEPVLAASFPTPRTVMLSGTGKQLGVAPIGNTRRRELVSRTIKRAHLQRALQQEAASRGVPFEYGKRLASVETSAEEIVARFDDDSEARGDVVIGCDGVHSMTRRLIDPAAPQPRYVGLLNFGGYTASASVTSPGIWHMIFGTRGFFGYVTDCRGGTIWFANIPRHSATDAERSLAAEEWKHRLVDVFADDRGPAVDLIQGGDLELVADNTHDLGHVPTWHRDRLIAIGDAVHAPSPTSGQGASMAIEDAVVLAKCLRDMPDYRAAFGAFERLRRDRVQRIVAYGARGSSNKTVGPIGRIVRDAVLPLVFRYLVTEKSVGWIYDHHIDWEQRVTPRELAAA